MLKEKEIKALIFRADQEGINKLKNEFFDEAREFIYFRKGAWNGFESSFQHTRKWVVEHPEFVLTFASLNPIIREIVDDIADAVNTTRERAKNFLKNYYGKNHDQKQVICFRAIVVEGALSKSDIAKWEKISDLKGSIKTIPKSQKGYFRYLVNEKRYAIFCRVNENLLQGIISYDKNIIDLLKYKFDLEFYISAYTHVTRSLGSGALTAERRSA